MSDESGSDCLETRVVLSNISPEHSEDLAKLLVERDLAACVNIVPKLVSFYKWEGKLCRDEECTLIIKTHIDKVQAVKVAIQEHHPYDMPEILSLKTVTEECDKNYLSWVKSMTSKG